MIAKGKSWRRPNPGDTLKRLIAENPKAGKRKLLALFVEGINGTDGKGALDSMAKYLFEVNYDLIVGKRVRQALLFRLPNLFLEKSAQSRSSVWR